MTTPTPFALRKPGPALAIRASSLRPALFLALCAAVPVSLSATDGTWIKTNASPTQWSLATNWFDGTIADGVGATATFNAANTGGTREIQLEGTSRTLGTMNITYNRATSASLNYTFSGSGGTLTFANNGSAASLNLVLGTNVTTHSTTFSAPVVLTDSLNINNGTTGGLTFSGGISGEGGIKLTAGTTTFAADVANTYTGGTTLETGATLVVSGAADTALGGANGAVTFNGGTLESLTTGFTAATREAIINSAGGTLKIGAFVNWSGVVSGTGLLTKTGNSTLSLNNVLNSHTGGIQVDTGILRMRYGDGSFGGAGNGVTFANGTNFLIQDAYTAGSGRALALTSGNVNFDIRSNFTWEGSIAGDGGFTKIGTAILTLAGTNTYTGGTTLNVGTVAITADAQLGATTGAVTFNGGTLEINASIQTDALREAKVEAGGGTLQTDAFVNWNGVVSGAGLLTKTGSNTLSLNNVGSTHTGGIQVDAGTLRIRNGDGAFGGAGNSVTFAAGTSFLIFDAYTAGSGRALNLTSGNVNFDIRQNFIWQGGMGGAGGFTKVGNGDLVLAGTNTHAGPTALSIGRLFVNGSIASAVTAADGTTFGGTGTSSADVTLNAGSTFAAGHNGIGTFATTGTLALNEATYALEFNSTLGTFDRINAAAVALSNALLTVTDLGSGTLNEGSIFTILENTGSNTVTGGFFGLAEGATVAAGTHQFTISYLGGTGNDITLTVLASVIPEPSTYAALAGLGVLALGALRRRRAKA